VLRIAAAIGYHTILWDTDGGDGRSAATRRSIIRDGRNGANGAIVLLHCGPAATPDAVAPLIDDYRARGYRLVDLARMLDLEPPATACRVTNVDRDDVSTSLQRAVRQASSGDRLSVRGTCLGSVQLRKDLEIAGERTESSGLPTLDGIGSPAVVTVKPGIAVTLRDLSIQGGQRGVLNRGSLRLRDATVLGNGARLEGGGAYNAAGGILVLEGSSSIRHNTARGAGGGVLNAGLLVLRDSSSIAHNVVRAGSIRAAGDIELPVATRPMAGEPRSGGGGGGVMNLGLMLGAVCAPADEASIRTNSPDDCRSAPLAIPTAMDATPRAP
jgi:hypothetical protein